MSVPEGHGYIDFIDGEEHFWFVRTLWAAAADAPVEEVPLDAIPWKDDGCFILGERPTWGGFAQHVARTLAADLSYPVILSPDGDVMDGMHRIVKAATQGATTVRVVRLAVRPPPDRR